MHVTLRPSRRSIDGMITAAQEQGCVACVSVASLRANGSLVDAEIRRSSTILQAVTPLAPTSGGAPTPGSITSGDSGGGAFHVDFTNSVLTFDPNPADGVAYCGQWDTTSAEFNQIPLREFCSFCL